MFIRFITIPKTNPHKGAVQRKPKVSDPVRIQDTMSKAASHTSAAAQPLRESPIYLVIKAITSIEATSNNQFIFASFLSAHLNGAEYSLLHSHENYGIMGIFPRPYQGLELSPARI